MIANDAKLTPYGEWMLADDAECESCGRSMIARFGGLVGGAECPSCAAEFDLLNRAGKLVLEEVDD